MTTRQYKAIKNFFHNEMRVDRPLLKEILAEVVKEVLHEELERYFQTYRFEKIIANHINGWDLRQAVAAKVLEKIDIKVEKK